MLGNILFIGFVIFSLFESITGFAIGMQQPILFLVSILSIFLIYFLLNLGEGKIYKGISINKNSLIGKIKQNSMARIFTVGVLWILAIGNFTYAHNWIGTTAMSGAEYIDAIILSFMSFVILSPKVKKS